jgi:hypothetical protein
MSAHMYNDKRKILTLKGKHMNILNCYLYYLSNLIKDDINKNEMKRKQKRTMLKQQSNKNKHLRKNNQIATNNNS